jgi:hypothetical protein
MCRAPQQADAGQILIYRTSIDFFDKNLLVPYQMATPVRAELGRLALDF